VQRPGAGRIASGAADPLAIGHAGHLAQWTQIVSALETSAPVPVGVDDAVETVRLLSAIYRAGADGVVVRVTA
jgi:hypothetical protein